MTYASSPTTPVSGGSVPLYSPQTPHHRLDYTIDRRPLPFVVRAGVGLRLVQLQGAH
jgi:hypothetical protein